MAMPKHHSTDIEPIAVQENVPLAPFTSLHIGGPARFFIIASSVGQLRQAILFARRKELPFCMLGGGSNLLASDAGFAGAVIRLQLKGTRVAGHRVEAQAGVDLTELVKLTPQWGLSGIETLAGIPGLVGGAVRGNAGAFGGCIGDVTERVSALDADSLELVDLDRESCSFEYRNSRFKREAHLIVVSVLLALTPAPPAEIESKVAATIRKREARKLQCDRSAGSFFMNPVVSDPELILRFEADQGVHCRECRIPAGWLIDQAGLRSLKVGGAMVSPRHANYLINTGNASAEQMIELARRVKDGVLAALGVQLSEEVSCLGFDPFSHQ